MWIREGHGGTRNLSQSGSNEQGEDHKDSTEFSGRNRESKRCGFSGRKQVISKKKDLHWNCKGFSGRNMNPSGDLQKKKVRFPKMSWNPVSVHKTTKIPVANTNLGLDLHSSSPEPVNFFGAHPSLGGAQFSFGGAQAVIWGGTAPVCPPWRRACSQHHNYQILVRSLRLHGCSKCLRSKCPTNNLRFKALSLMYIQYLKIIIIATCIPLKITSQVSIQTHPTIRGHSNIH